MNVDEELKSTEKGTDVETEQIDEENSADGGVLVEGELSEDGSGSEREEFDEGDDSMLVIDPADNEEGYEVVELELSDDDIQCYLEDEEGNEIGFVLLDEEGNEVEYFYVESDADDDGEGADEEDNEFDLGITKEGVAQATGDVNAIYKDGIAVAGELKAAFDDIKDAFNFGSFLK